MLIDSVSKGGNLLLNVGPTGRGEFDERALNSLYEIGKWMRRHSRAIYGCTQAPLEFKAPECCKLTYNPEKQRLYIHVLSWQFNKIYLEVELVRHVDYVQLLSDASEIRFSRQGEDTVELNIPLKKPLGCIVPVLEVFLK